MKNTGIAIHGGAGEDSPFIRDHLADHMSGLKAAISRGYKLLRKGAPALDVVEETVRSLEDNPLFNAGRGSALNRDGEVEMDAAIMDGKTLKAGAVSMIRNVKNPISLARTVMHHTKHVYIAGEGALKVARIKNMEFMPDDYFIVEHRRQQLLEEATLEEERRHHGTVGCVALDAEGNLAAATSTGGIVNSLPGRVGDSCIIGAGCFAYNGLCAVSCTGEGELIMTGVVAHKIAMLIELKGLSIQEACNAVIHDLDKPFLGDLGIVSVDAAGNLGIAFNSERMHRAWVDGSGKVTVRIYADNKQL